MEVTPWLETIFTVTGFTQLMFSAEIRSSTSGRKGRHVPSLAMFRGSPGTFVSLNSPRIWEGALSLAVLTRPMLWRWPCRLSVADRRSSCSSRHSRSPKIGPRVTFNPIHVFWISYPKSSCDRTANTRVSDSSSTHSNHLMGKVLLRPGLICETSPAKRSIKGLACSSNRPQRRSLHWAAQRRTGTESCVS